MKTTLSALAPLLAVALLSLPAAAAPVGDASPETPDLVEAAAADGRFTVLLRAVRAAGLEEALREPGPLTVFAPTDEAFRRLPAGALDALLAPGGGEGLRRLLSAHVVRGRLLAADLLPDPLPRDLSGSPLPLVLRIGEASIVAADIPCSNGVLHAIDRVLLPAGPPAVAESIRDAIDRGVPLFNAGDAGGCAEVYAAAARALLAREGALGELQEAALREALDAPGADPSSRAWSLRRAFDGILEDEAFRPVIEAPLPEGFPAPGPVGRVVLRDYPAYRAARAPGAGSFFTLFEHIQRNRVAMTAPVEMTMDEELGTVDMAFLYERPSQGAAGDQGKVSVLDLPARRVLSIGMRGDRTGPGFEGAKSVLLARMERDGLEADGPFRALGYNSPMVPAARRYWELQVPVRPR